MTSVQLEEESPSCQCTSMFKPSVHATFVSSVALYPSVDFEVSEVPLYWQWFFNYVVSAFFFLAQMFVIQQCSIEVIYVDSFLFSWAHFLDHFFHYGVHHISLMVCINVGKETAAMPRISSTFLYVACVHPAATCSTLLSLLCLVVRWLGRFAKKCGHYNYYSIASVMYS